MGLLLIYILHVLNAQILGIDGTDGEDVPKLKDEAELTRLGFKCGNVTIVNKGSEYRVEHRFCGTPAVRGSDGGDGGCGGSGGEGGKVQILGLTNQSNIVAVKQNGMGKYYLVFVMLI